MITVVDVRGDQVKLGISAPASVTVHRKEIYEAIAREHGGNAVNRKDPRWADVFTPVPDEPEAWTDWEAAGRPFPRRLFVRTLDTVEDLTPSGCDLLVDTDLVFGQLAADGDQFRDQLVMGLGIVLDQPGGRAVDADHPRPALATQGVGL